MRFDQLNRREFIALPVGAAIAWPLAARAQQAAKLPTIGFLGSATPTSWSPWLTVFVQRLHELGWTEGRNVAIEVRWGEGRSGRFSEIAAEFVRLKVDVIVTGGQAALAVKQATSVIPIIFAVAADPVGSGLVRSLARPGSNATGLSMGSADVVGKRVELLREVVPSLSRLAILANASYSATVLEMDEARKAARTLGLEAIPVGIRQTEDILLAFETLIRSGAQALYVCTDPLVSLNLARINTLALGGRLATMHGVREYVEAGGLMSYGANFPDLFRRAAELVDKVLRGTQPADIPVEQPTKFDLVINLTTARALGLEIPPSLLARADQVIE
jgi:putative ABC transport system substrate-binding protein